jgi:hypothetical protein
MYRAGLVTSNCFVKLSSYGMLGFDEGALRAYLFGRERAPANVGLPEGADSSAWSLPIQPPT